MELPTVNSKPNLEIVGNTVYQKYKVDQYVLHLKNIHNLSQSFGNNDR